MATFHCYAEVEDVRGIIERFCNEYDTQLHRVSDNAYQCLITGHWHSPDMEIGVNGDRPPVTVTLSITLSEQARRTVFGLVFLGFGCAALGIAWLFALGAYALVGLSIGVLLLASMMKLLDSTRRRASQAASMLTDALKSSMRVVQVSPLRLFESCALWSQAALAVALLGAFVLALAVTFGLFFTAVVSIGFGVMISAVLLAVRLKHSWRGLAGGPADGLELPQLGRTPADCLHQLCGLHRVRHRSWRARSHWGVSGVRGEGTARPIGRLELRPRVAQRLRDRDSHRD